MRPVGNKRGSDRPELLLSDQDLALEVLRMTDQLTDELVTTALSTAQRVCFPVSRLVLDPERFPIDSDEPMSWVGMGVIYERTSYGALLRLPPTPAVRQRRLETYYAPHHAALEASVASALERHGWCAILDIHSFPSRPLPYELDQASDRPDICIGTDEFHTPAPLADEFVRRFSAESLAVARNRPFSRTCHATTLGTRGLYSWWAPTCRALGPVPTASSSARRYTRVARSSRMIRLTVPGPTVDSKPRRSATATKNALRFI